MFFFLTLISDLSIFFKPLQSTRLPDTISYSHLYSSSFFFTSVFTSDFTKNFLFGHLFNYFPIFFPVRIMLLTRDPYSFGSNLLFHQVLESHWSLLSTFRTLPSQNQVMNLTIPSSPIVGCLWSNLLFFFPGPLPLPGWLE